MNTDLRARVAAHPLWYHTLELGSGVTTPGWFDLRDVVKNMPWPDVKGKRCLDIGTWDGHLAFEMERRGASEVVATDIKDHADWDHLPRFREEAVAFYESNAGTKGEGFLIAAEALESKVTREWINIYDLSPQRVGTFDVVMLGSLLLHLSNPFGALEAVRSVINEGGMLLSAEQIETRMSLLAPNRPVLSLGGVDGRWMIPNAAGHRRMLEMAGFDTISETRPYVIPFGPNHPERPSGLSHAAKQLATRVVVRGNPEGVPHHAVLSRRAI